MDIFNEFTNQQYSDFSFICSSELRLQIILRLLVQSLTPGELTDSIGMTFSQISRALGELLERKLVQVQDPDIRKDRYFSLTDDSKIILTKLKEFLDSHL